jgi:PAS domain S-box-containing protein
VEPTGANPEAQFAVQRLAAVVACSDDAILTKSAQGIITSWNPAAERLYGYRAGEAIGQPISILIPPSRRGEERLILRRVLDGERIEHYETERVRKDGRIIIVSLSISPVCGLDGAIDEASVIARDVTAVRRAERQRERLQAVTAALSGATTPREVADVVLDEGFAVAAADAAVVALMEPGSDRLRIVGLRGYPPHLEERLREISVDSPLPIGEALRTGEPVWIPDAREAGRRYPQEATRFELERGSALAALPLRVRGHTIGALALRFRRGQRIEDEDRAFMCTLADQCAQALERARLFDTERAARRRAEYLARAGSLLADSLNPQATMEQVARLAVPELADWAFVELLREDGVIAREAVVHRDPAKEHRARELAERYPVDRNAPHGSAKVLRTGQPELVRDVTDELLRAAAVSDEHLEILREVGFASAMIVPLRARGRVLGTIALASAESARRFEDDDLAMAQELADRCALALDNALLFAERSYIAKTLQEGLLPAGLPDIPRVELAAHYRAGREQADVGGDFYDVFGAGGAWMFVIGDVVGKGAKAAAITGLARHTLRAAALYEHSPAQMMRVLNRAMRAQFTDDEQFCTAAVARLHGDELCVALGGHPLPLIARRDGSAQTVGRPGTLIGVLDEPIVSEERVHLHPGESVVLYTDGVTDTHGAHGRFGAERLATILAMSLRLPAAQTVVRIDRALSAYRVGEPTDDSAILAFRLTSQSP